MIETPQHYRDSEYYDSVYAKRHAWYECDPEKSQWFQMWKKMLELSGKRIVDIGCGIGQVAYLAVKMGHDYVIGVDFSREAIQQARERCPSLEFICSDVSYIRAVDPDSYDTVFVAETLEHLMDDMEFLNLIPSGKHIVFSVPDLPSLGHMRYFENLDDVRDRYENLIDINIMDSVSIGKKYTWFIVSGVKK